MEGSERLYHHLLKSMGLAGTEETRSVTIAEIYQRLVPYRTVRTDLGFVELPQYEHALLELLADEGERVVIEHEQVREELRRELRSAHPILGIYRDYAAVKVRVSAGRRSPSPPQPRAPSERTDPIPEPPKRGAGSPPAQRENGERVPAVCDACGNDLPSGPDVRYCPFCGVAVRPAPCMECGMELRPSWAYCPGCGVQRVRGAISS